MIPHFSTYSISNFNGRICATWKTEDGSNIVEFSGGYVQDYDMIIIIASARGV